MTIFNEVEAVDKKIRMIVLSLDHLRVEFNEDFLKKVFNRKGSRANNFELFVPSFGVRVKFL